MFVNVNRKLKLNGAILLFSCFFCVVFATTQLNPLATKQTKNAVPCNTHGSRVTATNNADAKLSAERRFWQERPPSAYCVRIEGCNELIMKTPKIQKFETRPFSVGGFNWTLIFKPLAGTGDAALITAEVSIDPTGLVGENREVYADIRFLAYSKGYDKYWTSTDTDVRRFHQFRTTWGVPNFLSYNEFYARKDTQFNFDDDQCVFGVDISVYPYFNKWEVLSIDKTIYGPNSWKLSNFSTLLKDFYVSGDFSVGGKKWALKVYPNGNGTGEGNSLSLYVVLSENQTLKPYEKVFVRAKLGVLDQKQSKHLEKPILSWFDTLGEGYGFEQFVSLTDLRNPAKGFHVDDALSVQVQFEATSSTSYYSTSAAQLMSTF